MGLSAAALAAWASVAVGAGSAIASNVRANRMSTKPNKTAVQAPSSAVDKAKEEEKITLGSGRNKVKGRDKGRRSLMSTQTPVKNSTGLQI